MKHQAYWNNKDEEMRWYHYLVGMGVFSMVPFADTIADGIMKLFGVK